MLAVFHDVNTGSVIKGDTARLRLNSTGSRTFEAVRPLDSIVVNFCEVYDRLAARLSYITSKSAGNGAEALAHLVGEELD
jgi:hypothetical protein